MILYGGELYATAAISGAAVFVGLKAVGTPSPVPSGGGMAVIVGLRLAAIVWGLRVPAFSLDRG